MPDRMGRSAVPLLLFALACAVPALGAASARGAKIARWTGDLDVADAALRAGDLDRAGDGYGRVLSEIPRDAGPALLLARGLDGLGDVERLRGNAAAAADSYRRAIVLWEEVLGPRQPRLAVTLHNLGAVLVAEGRLEEARAALERALSIWSASPASVELAENTRRLLERTPRASPADP